MHNLERLGKEEGRVENLGSWDSTSHTRSLLLGMAGCKLLLCFAQSWGFGSAARESCLPVAEKPEWGPVWTWRASALPKIGSRHCLLGCGAQSARVAGQAGDRRGGGFVEYFPQARTLLPLLINPHNHVRKWGLLEPFYR